MLLFFILSGKVKTGQELLASFILPSNPLDAATLPFRVMSVMDWGKMVESVEFNHTREYDVSSIHMLQQRCCFSIAIDSPAAFDALAEGDFLYSPVLLPPPPIPLRQFIFSTFL